MTKDSDRFQDPAAAKENGTKEKAPAFKPYWAIIERPDDPDYAHGITEGRARMIHSPSFAEEAELNQWISANVDVGYDQVLAFRREIKPGGGGFRDHPLLVDEEVFPAHTGRRDAIIARARRAITESAAAARTSMHATRHMTPAERGEEARARLEAAGRALRGDPQ